MYRHNQNLTWFSYIFSYIFIFSIFLVIFLSKATLKPIYIIIPGFKIGKIIS